MTTFEIKLDLADCINQFDDKKKTSLVYEIFYGLDKENQRELLEIMLDTLSGKEVIGVIEKAFDNLNERAQANVQSYVNEVMGD